MLWRRRFSRTRRGDFAVSLPDAERELLRGLPTQLRELLATEDPSLERLFPPAYLNDDERNAEFARLMHMELLGKRLATLDLLEETLDADRLTEEQILAWLGSLNDTRLVIGTILDVSEDMEPDAIADDDPRFPMWVLYHFLSGLVGEIVDALDRG
ncbi:MAG TPA: DUF2017 family protein [Acidimicrobiales bacterium]|nr:DUF2017 family protein [Acidimicrobiales bacterium]